MIAFLRRIVRDEISISPVESAWHDIARCVLMIEVMFGHLNYLVLPTLPILLTNFDANIIPIILRLLFRFGSSAAELFIMLSGYMVGGQIIKQIIDGRLERPAVFFRRRLFRLVPLSLLAIISTATLDYVGMTYFADPPTYSSLLGRAVERDNTLLVFLGNIFFLQPILVNSYGSNGPLWTIGYILQFYVCAYSLAWCGSKNRLLFIFALTVTVIIGVFSPAWIIRFSLWGTGAFLRVAKFRCSRPWLLGTMASVGIVIAHRLPSPLSVAVMIIPALMLVLWMRTTNIAISELLRPAFSYSSRVTFAVYLLHFPIAVLVIASLRIRYGDPFHYYIIAIASTVGASLFLGGLAEHAERLIKNMIGQKSQKSFSERAI